MRKIIELSKEDLNALRVASSIAKELDLFLTPNDLYNLSLPENYDENGVYIGKRENFSSNAMRYYKGGKNE